MRGPSRTERLAHTRNYWVGSPMLLTNRLSGKVGGASNASTPRTGSRQRPQPSTRVRFSAVTTPTGGQTGGSEGADGEMRQSRQFYDGWYPGHKDRTERRAGILLLQGGGERPWPTRSRSSWLRGTVDLAATEGAVASMASASQPLFPYCYLHDDLRGRLIYTAPESVPVPSRFIEPCGSAMAVGDAAR